MSNFEIAAMVYLQLSPLEYDGDIYSELDHHDVESISEVAKFFFDKGRYHGTCGDCKHYTAAVDDCYCDRLKHFYSKNFYCKHWEAKE